MNKPKGTKTSMLRIKKIWSGANQKRNGKADKAAKSMKAPPYSKM
jgi:hypothetical protein